MKEETKAKPAEDPRENSEAQHKQPTAKQPVPDEHAKVADAMDPTALAAAASDHPAPSAYKEDDEYPRKNSEEEPEKKEELAAVHEADLAAQADAPADFSQMLAEASASQGNIEVSFAEAESADDQGFAQFGDDGGGMLLPILGIAALGIGIAVLASDGDNDDDDDDIIINDPPAITAEAEVTVDENIDSEEVILDVDAVDPDGDDVTFSLTGADAASFTIDEDDGEVRFVESPDAEEQEDYAITVVATDSEGNTAEQDVAINVVDADEDPLFPDQELTFNVLENTLPGTVLYSAGAFDPEGEDITLTVQGEDADFFAIDAETQAVFLTKSPDFEDQETLNFQVVASDPQGNETSQEVTVNVIDVVDEPFDNFEEQFGLIATRLTGEDEYMEAESFYYTSFTDLNGSGVSGFALLGLDEDTGELTVTIQASGLDPNQVHPQHIHGFMEDDMGNVQESEVPTMDVDADMDGFIELMEAAGSYGPVLLSLTENDDFPTADADGNISFTATYQLPEQDLSDDPLLDLREIVLHGDTLQAGEGANGGEADGTAGYKATLPVAAGEIDQVVAGNALETLLSLNSFLPDSSMMA